MTDGVSTTISGGLVQGVVGAGTVHIENLVFNNYGVPGASAPTSLAAADDTIQECPYPGLAYFGPGDADFFFGREAAIDRLAHAVRRQGFTSVVGASGSGKSSLVLAGLAPHLASEGSWVFGYFRIATELDRNPFSALARVLVPFYVDTEDATDRLLNTRKLAGLMASGDLGLSDVLTEIRSRNKGRRILLIVDQFEEVFTTIGDEPLRKRFLDVLFGPFLDRHAEGAPQISLVMTLRADFYGRALQDRYLADLMQDHVENVGPMNRMELESAIRNPAAKRGVVFEPGLVETLLERVDTEPGALPLLQFALREMWRRQTRRTLTRTAYDDIGGIEGALAKRAEDRFANETGRDASLEGAFRRLFTRLVAPGDGHADTRRVAAKSELGEAAWSLAQRMADEENRLVVTSAAPGGLEKAELAHEALIPHWPRLAGWLARDRAFRLWLDEIRRSVERWSADSSDEGPLLRSGMLAQAADWLDARRDDLSADEVAFVEASVALKRDQDAREEADRQLELQRQRELAEASERARAEAERRAEIEARARKQAMGRQLSASAANLVGTDYGAALLLAVEATKVDDTIDSRGTLSDLVRKHPNINAYLRQPSPGRYVGARIPQNPGVAFSPDGTLIASIDRIGGAAVDLWDTRLFRRITSLLVGHQDYVTSICFSDDGRFLASASADGVVLWNTADFARVAKLPFQDAGSGLTAEALAIDGQSARLAVGTNAGGDGNAALRIWDISKLEVLCTLKVAGRDHYLTPSFGISRLRFRLDGRSIVVAVQPFKDFRVGRRMIVPKPGVEFGEPPLFPDEGFITVLDINTGKPLSEPWIGGALAVSPDCNTILARNKVGDVTLIYDAERQAHPLPSKSDWGLGAFSGDGRNFCLVEGRELSLIDMAASRIHKAVHPSPDCRFYSIAVSPDGATIATSDSDDAVMLWSLKSGRSVGRRLLEIPQGAGVPPTPLAFSPDSSSVLVANGFSREILVWTMGELHSIASLNASGSAGESSINTLAVLRRPEGATTLVSFENGDVVALDPQLEHGNLVEATRNATALASAGLACVWIAGDASGHVEVFEGSAPGRSMECLPQGEKIKALALDPAGRLAAASGPSGRVRVWAIGDWSLVAELIPPNEYADCERYALAFSMGGERLLGLATGQAVLWEVATGAVVGRFASVDQMWGSKMVGAFSPTEPLFAVSSPFEPGIRLIRSDLVEPHGAPLLHYHGACEVGGAYGLAFSPDGTRLAATYGNGDLVLWDLSTRVATRAACLVANRNLTAFEWERYLPGEPYRNTWDLEFELITDGQSGPNRAVR